MNSKLFSSKAPLQQASNRPMRRARLVLILTSLAAVLVVNVRSAEANSDAPSWMHGLVSAPLPKYDEKTEAVVLYSEEILTVQADGKMKELDREAYKILRPEGRRLGKLHFFFDHETRITKLQAWCIPAQGRDYEVKEKDATETGYSAVEGGELFSDYHYKILSIPAPDPGNIIGYEIEHEVRPFVFQDEWGFQETFPVREAHYTLQLPSGWEYKPVWLNYSEIAPTPLGTNQWQWTVKDIDAIKPERWMPPFRGIASQLLIRIFPPGGVYSGKSFANWNDMGKWYGDLWKPRQNVSPEIHQKVLELTSGAPNKLAQMRALARFSQSDIRYVAIELGIGGWQPHSAADVFVHRFGDCKDKAALLSTMLREIGIDSYHVAVHTRRGIVGSDVPPRLGIFNHAILAIRLPDEINDPSLVATVRTSLGRLLIFDPTDEMSPFGTIRGDLQANYALLVTPDGGELFQIPKLSPALNGTQLTAKLSLSPQGILTGDVHEVRLGDFASRQRYAFRSLSKDADKVKPIETLMAHSLGSFHITKASVSNVAQTDQPFEFNWSFLAEDYGKTAGNLLLVRPRVLGNKSSDLLETKEPRRFPVEFEGPSRDQDNFEITLPQGYEVDDLPPPVDADYGFASYHSKSEISGNVLKYTRTFEVKDVSVPLSKVDDLRKLYRIIANDERNTAVLKPKS
jgi:Domain of Unknown Function with PDB structure (DUF3857)/Transglutaminase-like superfamily